MTDAQKAKLEYPFSVDDIEFRVLRTNKAKTVGYIAAYVDSRAIQRRLDEVVGWENWQNYFEVTQSSAGGEPTFVCRLSIYSVEKNEWLTKSNGAGSTDIEPIKGGLSTAFKRAASMWGIGRYLYDMKDIKCPVESGKYISDNERYKLEQEYVKFVNKLLAQKKNQQKPPSVSTGNASQETSANQPNSQQGQSGNQIPEGRFSDKQPLMNKAYWVADAIFNSEKNISLVMLDTPFGEKIKAFIKGQTTLKKGDCVNNPIIEVKKSGSSSEYNLITGYEKAA